ncbi:hypothetical protein [Shimia sp.]|uniref:hypothetical protein n=1 Tax=Shimia sp. TaxID=1954381 RepID=UPI003BAD091B
MNISIDDDDFYRPPEPTIAGLMFPARSKFTVRGFTMACTPAERYWRQIISASQGERECCLLALAMPELWNLFDQPRPVAFADTDGTQRTHRFDYLLALRDGTRVAVAVKPSERVKALNFRATLRAIKRDLPVGFADKVYLVTERERHKIEVRNAELLNFFRRSPDGEADQVIADLVHDLWGEVPISDLVEKSGLGAWAFRAAFRAIYAGQLRANVREAISINSVVAPRKENS